VLNRIGIIRRMTGRKLARSEMQKRNLLYYLFAAFIVAIFLWWWVLLFQKNVNVYVEKMALYDLIIDIDDSETTRQLYDQEVANLRTQHHRQKSMITWEGLTFLFLLILGIIRLNRYLQKEIALARQQSNFLLSITHELKSPLASALLNIQTLQLRKELPREKQEKLLTSSQSELTRLEELVAKILFAARMEGESIHHDLQEVDLSALYQSQFNRFADRWSGQFQVYGDIQKNLTALGDGLLLTSIFTNLTDNAAKYCAAGGEIHVDLRASNGEAHLNVSNDGPMIDAVEKQRIWQKFYRIGDEHTRSSTGTGLGLYIVRRVVESHGGKVDVADKPGGGVIFRVILPLAP
jgi:signal transduction histidine kinase